MDVIVECTACHAKYKYDESKFDGKKAKKIKCAKCGAVFEIANPSFDTVPASEIAENTSATDPKTGPPTAVRPTRTSPVPEPVEETKELRISREMLAGPAEPDAGRPDTKKFSLAVISGPDAGKMFVLDRPRTVIGRSGADLILNDTEISRKHCAVDLHEERAVLADLGSTNGTWVGDQRISEPTLLSNQSEFMVGSSNLMLIITEKD